MTNQLEGVSLRYIIGSKFQSNETNQPEQNQHNQQLFNKQNQQHYEHNQHNQQKKKYITQHNGYKIDSETYKRMEAKYGSADDSQQMNSENYFHK